MSGIYVRNHAIRFARTHVAGEQAREDLDAIIRAVDPAFQQWLHDLAAETHLGLEEETRRAAALLIQVASIQLADDLSDNECEYLPNPAQTGPGAQWLLQHLFAASLAETSISAAVVAEATGDLLLVGAAQQQEVRTVSWNLESSRAAAMGLNGHQHAAYFNLTFAGTARQTVARSVGIDYGFALHIVGDRVSRDPRWETLDATSRAILLGEASAAVARLRQVDWSCLRGPSTWFDSVLAPMVNG